MLIERKADISVEFKNGVIITGKITYVDLNFNINLIDLAINTAKYPHFVNYYNQNGLKSIMIRGAGIRHIHLPFNENDITLLQ